MEKTIFSGLQFTAVNDQTDDDDYIPLLNACKRNHGKEFMYHNMNVKLCNEPIVETTYDLRKSKYMDRKVYNIKQADQIEEP